MEEKVFLFVAPMKTFPLCEQNQTLYTAASCQYYICYVEQSFKKKLSLCTRNLLQDFTAHFIMSIAQKRSASYCGSKFLEKTGRTN